MRIESSEKELVFEYQVRNSEIFAIFAKYFAVIRK